MDTPEKYSKNGLSEGNPGTINPDDITQKDIAKNLTTNEKPDIKESEFGRERGQTPAEEQFDQPMAQIDEETKRMNEKSESMEQTVKKEFDTDDFRRVDERDNNDSTEQWNAEKSRTSHNK